MPLVSFCFFLGLVPLCRCFYLRGCWCLSVVVVLLSVGGWATLCLSWLFGCCRLPSLPIVASLPPAVGPVWRPGSLHAGPSGYLVAFVTAWLPCFIAGSVVVLCRPYFMLSHGSKGLWPCVGFVFPLHHDACVVRVLSITTLRYSSMMIQVPHWTPLSFTIAILKQ